MQSHRRHLNLSITSLMLSFWVIILSLTGATCCNQVHNCRTVQPVYGYRLPENYSYQTLHHISLEKCIALCEQSMDCFSVSYLTKSNICMLNNVTSQLSFGDFTREDGSIYVENVLRPSSCFSHVCKPCVCWCEKVKPNGDCEGKLKIVMELYVAHCSIQHLLQQEFFYKNLMSRSTASCGD